MMGVMAQERGGQVFATDERLMVSFLDSETGMLILLMTSDSASITGL